MAKMRKVTLYVLDLNDPVSDQDLKFYLENMKFLSNKVGEIKTADIGQWHDDHELNKHGVDHEKYFK